jgi:hypothetical protein
MIAGGFLMEDLVPRKSAALVAWLDAEDFGDDPDGVRRDAWRRESDEEFAEWLRTLHGVDVDVIERGENWTEEES